MAVPQLTLVTPADTPERAWAVLGGAGEPVNDAPEPASDAALIARMVTGDQQAFAEVYDRHASVVYGSVVRFLGDRETAEEIVQDAYLSAWRRADQYVPGAGTVLGWLLGIARNRAIDRLRAASRRPRLVGIDRSAEQGDDAFERSLAAWTVAGGGAEPGPEAAALRAWERAVVRSALEAMPPLERRPLELAYDEGLTQAEVATRLGWPLGTVKTRTRRGLAALRAALEGVPGLVDADPAPDAARDAGPRRDQAMGDPRGSR